VEGIGWISRYLDAWQECGAQRFIDFRELASALGHTFELAQCENQIRLHIQRSELAPPLIRPLPLRISMNGARLPDKVAVVAGQESFEVPLFANADGFGSLDIPAGT
jgi:hypothetical protein